VNEDLISALGKALDEAVFLRDREDQDATYNISTIRLVENLNAALAAALPGESFGDEDFRTIVARNLGTPGSPKNLPPSS